MTPDWLRGPCRLGSLLLLVRHLPSPALILVWFQVSQAGLEPPGPSDCAGQQLPDRILCGRYRIHRVDCVNLGCCFDDNYNMCFFPVSCEQFATIAGGYSALLLLPGKDQPGQGSVSMLEGGNWCSREARPTKGSLQIEMDISEVRLVYLTTTFTAAEAFSHPFTFHFSVENYKFWRPLHEPNMTAFPDGSGTFQGYTQKVVYTLYANRLKIHPKRDRGRPCVKVDVVTCPGIPPTPEPDNVTIVIPTTEAPTSAPEITKDDKRPTAVAIGSFVVILLACLFALLILLDVPTFAKNFMYMKRSIASFIRYYRKKCALVNGGVCREEKVNDGGIKMSASVETRGDNVSPLSDELLLTESPAFDIIHDMEAQHTLVHPELSDDMGIGDWMTESDDASLVQYETVF